MASSFFERKKREDEIKREGRLPPGQSLTLKFPVLQYGPIPDFDPSTWTFEVWGEVEKPFKLTWDEFSQLPRTKRVLDIHCVTSWSKFDTEWEGVSVRDLVDSGVIQLKPSAKYVIQHAEFGFTANLPLSVVMADNFLMATHYDGQPLPPEHGAPLRGVVGAIKDRSDLMVPYFWKGAKWLRGLQFTAVDRRGFWEQAGYHNEGDVWKEERYG